MPTVHPVSPINISMLNTTIASLHQEVAMTESDLLKEFGTSMHRSYIPLDQFVRLQSICRLYWTIDFGNFPIFAETYLVNVTHDEGCDYRDSLAGVV